jgi:alanine racemase
VRSWIEISRSAIRDNFRSVKTAVGPSVEVMPVVKADAYRHGAIEVSRILEAEGAQWLAVSNVEEGIALRESSVKARILVMADYLPENRRLFKEFSLTPVIHSLEDIPSADVPYHLKIDSGMGRLGVRDTPEEIARAVGTKLEGLMTHFASSANYTSSQTNQQIERFESVLKAVGRPRYVHLSSTIPVAYKRTEAWGNLVRPGHAIYGYVSPARGQAPRMDLHVRPALTWKATVLSVKDVESGALIGYGGIYKASKPMRIAILAAGYADGIPHRLSNRGKVLVHGKLTPIVGAVSMDLTTIEVPEDTPSLRAGDAVTLLGPGNDAQEMARIAGTISYSVLCGISARVKRIFVE